METFGKNGYLALLLGVAPLATHIIELGGKVCWEATGPVLGLILGRSRESESERASDPEIGGVPLRPQHVRKTATLSRNISSCQGKKCIPAVTCRCIIHNHLADARTTQSIHFRH